MDKNELADFIAGERAQVEGALRNLVLMLDTISGFPWWVRFCLKGIVALLTQVNLEMSGLCEHIRRGQG